MDKKKQESQLTGDEVDERFWSFWVLEYGDGDRFGENTMAIVDEKQGGIILYCHEDNAEMILTALRDYAENRVG